ncbi:Ig-like domain-containing protein [Candidatus Palauibacter sp.]|uniref:Ig-like domain-containing protein n=1 Tax=Candidatus Palauibacter sp. TaxID=3101350 RepID=UPI003B025407
MTRPSRPNRASLGLRAALLLPIILAWYCGGSPAGPDPTPEPPPPDVPLPAATVEVAPGSVVLRSLGDTETLAATVRSRDGAVLPNASVDWASSDPTVASVDAGTVTALSNGEASVTATSGAASGSAAVRVEQVAARLNVVPRDVSFAAIGDTARLSATAYDGNDHEVADATVEWSSTYPDVATVSDDGLVTAVSPGTAEIVAASGAAKDTVAVNVDSTDRGILCCVLSCRGRPILASQRQVADGRAAVGMVRRGNGDRRPRDRPRTQGKRCRRKPRPGTRTPLASRDIGSL